MVGFGVKTLRLGLVWMKKTRLNMSYTQLALEYQKISNQVTRMDEQEYYDDFDVENSYWLEDDDYEFWEELFKLAIARQGPQYSEYQSCMWE